MIAVVQRVEAVCLRTCECSELLYVGVQKIFVGF